MENSFYIIDGSSYIFRAYFAIRELSTASGLPTNAVYGFTKMLLKIIKVKKPDYLAMTFDSKAPTFRHALYEDYKANRPPMPDSLALQIPYIDKMVNAFQIPLLREAGLEADDLIGTLAKKGEAAGLDVVIVTGDKDMYQLISPQVTVYDSMKEKIFTEETIREKFGVEPDQIVEIMGLMGDAVDHIPGVRGIGKKTAMQLIQTFGTIENLLNRLNEVKRPKLKKTLEMEREMARLSRQLALIKTDCPISFDLETFKHRAPDSAQLLPLCQELSFSSLLKTLTPAPILPQLQYQIVDTEGLAEAISEIEQEQVAALSLLTSNEGVMNARPLGIALSTPRGKNVYFPFQKEKGFPSPLKELFDSEKVTLYGHGLKPYLTLLKRQGITCKNHLFDTKISAYLLNPIQRDYSLEGLALEYLKEQFNKDPLSSSGETPSPEVAAPLLCRETELILRLSDKLKTQLASKNLTKLFDEIEMPLVSVLSDIEQNGVKIDINRLAEMSKDLKEKLALLTEKIYELAGGEFNINSPKQLSEILFNRLELTPIKKTKTGYSTNEEVLKQLSLRHPLPAEILNSRQITKLKSTYIDALPKLVHSETGRIHTRLNQTVTATGRLSSKDPNLQNIPVRGEMGRRIREAFIAEPGNRLLSADYNQIELRILAHLSDDPVLIQAFQNGEDIHTQTAVELFDLPKESITQEMRRAAKTVNFGIIYGISPFGLSNNLGVSLKEAKRYIDLYFDHYRGVKLFFEETLKKSTELGYVTTLFGRRRQITELASRNNFTRGIGERIAMNTPVQGSAADIIKLAMIDIWEWMKAEGIKSKMTLQVHDELLFDIPEEEVPVMKNKIAALMENAVKLKVPLKVDVGVGDNWAEAH